MDVKIIIDGRVLSIYKDETINITSKLQDIEKLSNVFNDYSNQFTIPGDNNNNEIFKHYYNIDLDNSFNANIKVAAYIEVNSLPFKFGYIQLQSVTMKENRVDNYKILFFGGLKQLSDLFGDDTLDKLDYDKDEFGNLTKVRNDLSQFDMQYTSGDLINSINLTTYKDGNVITPLIAYTNRDWTYNTDDIYDISNDSSAIKHTELRPALRIYNLLVAIENKYNISFTRSFFGKATFQNIFMWLNKQEEIKAISYTITPTPFVEWAGYEGTNTFYSVEDDFVKITYDRYNTDGLSYKTKRIYVRYWIYPEFLSVQYRAKVTDESGNIISEIIQTGNGLIDLFYDSEWKTGVDYDEQITRKFKIEFEAQFTMDVDVNIEGFYTVNNPRVIFTRVWSNNTKSIDNIISINQNIPQLKVSDFFSGIMKMFKLIIRPLSDKVFYVDTLNSYYSNGNILNLTEYIDNKTVSIEKPSIFRKIDFKHIKSDNAVAKKFRKDNDPLDEKGYGDLISRYPEIVDKDELKIETPFELMIYENLKDKLTNLSTNITIGQSISLSDDGITTSKNDSGPILFYSNGLNNHSDYPVKLDFFDAIGSFNYSRAISNINDNVIDQVTDSLCFGSEVDPITLYDNQISLYKNYWEDWIKTIYSLKQRKFTYSAQLPTRYVQELSLNDRIIIGSNRFKIQEYTVDINDGTTKLILFNDIFNNSSTTLPTLSRNTYQMNAGAKYIDIALNINGTGDWVVTKIDTGDGTSWVDVLTPSGTNSSNLLFYIHGATTTSDRTLNINVSVNGDSNILQIAQTGL